MDLIALLKSLDVASQSLGKLKTFVHDDLDRVLEAIGDTAYDAAVSALQDAKRSPAPRDEINGAISNLRHAYSAYTKIIKKREKNILRDLGASFADYFSPIKAGMTWKPFERACRTALLIAACCKVLKKDSLCSDYLKKASDCFQSYRNNMSDAYSIVSGAKNSSKTNTTHNDRIEKQLDVEDKHFRSVVKNLKRL